MALVATLTMNPAVDLFTSVDRVEPRRKLRCHGEGRDPGGGGINVARVVHRLGGSAVAFYPAGGLTGELLQRLVGAEGLASRVTPIAGETREDITVLDEGAGEQYRFILPGPHLHGSDWLACLRTLAAHEETPAIVCASGSLPPGVPDDFYARVAEIAAGFGALFVLDASGPALRAALREHVHLIKPNLNELEELAGERLETETAQIRACRRLTQTYRLEAVALSLGEQGALLVSREEACRVRPPPVNVVSAVGAGDSFLGGMLWAMARGESLREGFAWAAAAGAGAVLAPGSELAGAADVRRLRPQVVIEELMASAAE